ncbi:Bax inhibitor-1/YccA family protein [Gynuella sunshinyii]|uniref:Integral membrane protein, interacts with FtsH n=1 Tax=Gynuella sunshinyii YC6258 TaxID=1445510 RepID=A0A0C5VZF2_9GAMM|nr:Bax inhibitor-1/YccA family protein [Gynuella sunshinyii]AJQ95784.1 integral membrane protein, interacts with FtsH [Gynuella sunshinyii YC6258]
MSDLQELNSIASGNRSATSVSASSNKVLRNTYSLLALTLLFSAFTAFAGMAMGIGQGASLVMMLGAIGILWFVLPRSINSGMGLVWTFVFTGLMGASLAPMLSYYVGAGMGGLVLQALGGTAVIFFALSAYALVTKRDFSFLGGILFIGLLVVLVAALANIFLAIPAMQLMVSSAVILIMSGYILYDTSRIIHGGETNYISATIGLYLNIYNIFVHLLSILGIMNDD